MTQTGQRQEQRPLAANKRERYAPRAAHRPGLRQSGREDRSFHHVCVLPGYKATGRRGREENREKRPATRSHRRPKHLQQVTEETGGSLTGTYYAAMT
ncbi:hypothetical protein Hsero_3171 [Herbaspirillum seropedicae SmR1]|uniref:Uncharacterized protein n=1 Tax=Herbaspirillum seropedicae (strain SmR1) TaxID=757424 RepID=D8J184_HERSS|nr:hypothetical protein Hsero_3171 [Herbaspirillum seropedicae SmR1]